MRLLLSMQGWPDGAKPETREIEAECSIGRGRENGWMLPDPASQLSRRHCVLVPSGEVWRVTDLSLNGTFINDQPSALGRERSVELHDGDRIRIGGYVIEARYQAPASLQAPMPEHVPFAPVGGMGPVDTGDDPVRWAAGAWRPGPTEAPLSSGHSHTWGGGALPDDFLGQPSSDHAPAVFDSWTPPPASKVVIPDDWNLEDFAPAPSGSVPAGVFHTEFVSPEPAPASRVNTGAQPDPAPPLFGAELNAPSQAAMPGESDLLAAFLAGAGLHGLPVADPATMMEAVGACLRVMVERLREANATRGTIKREFRILATAVRPDDNNPIKFAAGHDAALRSLLTGKRPPARAVAEALDDIRLHDLAMIAAMRDGVSGLMRQLDPAPLRAAAQEGGLAGLLPAQRKARAFDQYEALYARTVQALEDDFDSVFGKAFARAYERVALDEESQAHVRDNKP